MGKTGIRGINSPVTSSREGIEVGIKSELARFYSDPVVPARNQGRSNRPTQTQSTTLPLSPGLFTWANPYPRAVSVWSC